jgi:hypothetical protein
MLAKMLDSRGKSARTKKLNPTTEVGKEVEMVQLKDEAQFHLDTALFLLKEAIRYAQQGEIGGVSWRIADASEWLRKAADEQGVEVQGLHHTTGRGNILSQRPPHGRAEV